MKAQNKGNFQAAPNNCSAGGSHEFEDSYKTCGIVWAVLCFPLGLACLYSMREHKCKKCLTIFEN
ncbi:hypothetical protein DSO57_1021828 [Entomophthora muscae]|uniref:Uncharacterized protein n=1 Tax=Entomophthora muscae TaxID=34485 RepID=A0ACC2UPY1_9FUNG|nr:hypothetical protein DSO57_1021828 [Entomophthora muscae]